MIHDLPPGGAGSARPVPPGVDRVLSLLQLVGGLAAQVGFERSFKMTEGRLSQDRLLLGVDRPHGSAALDESIGRVCGAIGMPPELQEDFRRSLRSANHVYFGAERDSPSLTFKAYLEFRDTVTARLEAGQAGDGPLQLYTGYKWDADSGSRRAVSQYLWYPALPAQEILRRVEQVVDAASHPLVCKVIVGVARRALDVVSPSSVHYLEVREAGNPRQSIDLNVYKAGHRMEDLRPLLAEAARHYAVGPEVLDGLLRRIGDERFGHLAGGIDREGRDFLTFYYGGAFIDGGRLRSAKPAPDAA